MRTVGGGGGDFCKICQNLHSETLQYVHPITLSSHIEAVIGDGAFIRIKTPGAYTRAGSCVLIISNMVEKISNIKQEIKISAWDSVEKKRLKTNN